MTIPVTLDGPRIARNIVAVLLDGWRSAADLDAHALAEDAQLVVSELVTNAVRHAPTTSALELEVADSRGHIRISLADGSSDLPTVAQLDSRARSGRGMQIVVFLASEWGTEVFQGGKRVWVKLRTGL